jgi:hypothetical protein
MYGAGQGFALGAEGFGSLGAGSHPPSGSLTLPDYLRRIGSLQSMDMEYTFSQMVDLCFAPSRVYVTARVSLLRVCHSLTDQPSPLAHSYKLTAYRKRKFRGGCRVVALTRKSGLLAAVTVAHTNATPRVLQRRKGSGRATTRRSSLSYRCSWS